MNSLYKPFFAAGLLGIAFAANTAGVGCMDPNSAYNAQKDNPLGPSFWIIPTPSDDDALLGRTFAKPPDTALTLEEQSSPNPCSAKLAAKRESEMGNHYENAINTKTSANAGALLSMYGFGAEASSATHLVYKVNTTKKLTQLDTAEYQECCKEKGCGWGYIASLVRGEGEYAAATEASAQVSGNYTVLSGGVSRSYSVVNKKAIKGYIAAVIVAHNRAEAAQACPPDKVWAKIECVPKEMPARQEEMCSKGHPQAASPMWKDNPQMLSLFKQQQDDACRWLANHGGPPAPAPKPTAPPPGPGPGPGPGPATPPPADAKFEPGDYVAVNSFWSGKLTFRADGTFSRDNGDKGVWIADGKKLTLKWSNNSEDELMQSGAGTYQNMTGFFRIQRTGASAPTPGPAASSAAPKTTPPPAASSAAPPKTAPPPAASSAPPTTRAPRR